MNTVEELRFATLDRLSEVIEELAEDENWITEVIGAADVPYTSNAVNQVKHILKIAATGVYDV